MHFSTSHQSATLWTGLELLQKDGFKHLPLLTEALFTSQKNVRGAAGTAASNSATVTLLHMLQYGPAAPMMLPSVPTLAQVPAWYLPSTAAVCCCCPILQGLLGFCLVLLLA